MDTNHQHYMQRCLELAQNGLRAAMPNPSVGALLVYNGKIIGEGHTSPYGGPHGEVNCLNAVKPEDRHLIPKSTLYVSLEPCSHHGKTPPCCDLIIQQKIPHVVIGVADPYKEVAGNGIRRLRKAEKEVVVGVLEKECREINRRFFTYHEKQRPYIILKWAESADGYIAPLRLQTTDRITDKKPIWITNTYSRQLVHKWRAEEMAILVGTQTVLDDNPQLDVRHWSGPDPVRIVLDRTGRIPDNYCVKNHKIKTIVLTENSDLPNLENLLHETIDFAELPAAVANVLYRHKLLSVIIEGGAITLQAFIDAGLWDEARVFKGKAVLNGGTQAPLLSANSLSTETILNDELLIFRNYG